MEIWLSCSHLALLWILKCTGDLGLKFQIWKSMESENGQEKPSKRITERLRKLICRWEEGEARL